MGRLRSDPSTQAKYQSLDGAFFGPTFPHLLFLTYPELRPPIKRVSKKQDGSVAVNDEDVVMMSQQQSEEEDSEKDDEYYALQEQLHGDLPDYAVYTPRIFGFRVSQRASTGPRMGWLRHKRDLKNTKPQESVSSISNI